MSINEFALFELLRIMLANRRLIIIITPFSPAIISIAEITIVDSTVTVTLAVDNTGEKDPMYAILAL